MFDSLLKVGIDVGSTTIKVVVLDQERNIQYQKYARHFSEINAVLKENLAALSKVVEGKKFSLALTGSAGTVNVEIFVIVELPVRRLLHAF